jgi:hypothetical protein
MKTIMEKFETVAEMNRKLSDMIDEVEGTEWRTKHLVVNHQPSDYPADENEGDRTAADFADAEPVTTNE